MCDYNNKNETNDKNNIKDNKNKGDEDMATVEKVKEPTEQLKESFNEYFATKKSNKKMMSFSEMLQRLKEDDK